MLLLLALVIAAQSFEPMDLAALDAAVERCDRAVALPVFAAEAPRRNAAVTAFYQEQARIAAERLTTASQRRALREAPADAAAESAPSPSDKELSLRQLALDDRQRALDDQRRLESMRQEAVDLKRQYFLTRCPTGKKPE